MDIHPWTKYEVARARDEERQERAWPIQSRSRNSARSDRCRGRADPGRTRLVDRLPGAESERRAPRVRLREPRADAGRRAPPYVVGNAPDFSW
jgi:hypothetical protein